jgi:hypothetical protein
MISSEKSHYVYCVTNLINGRKYIGSHTGYVDDNYLGSGVIVTKAVSKYGSKNFVKQILWIGELQHMHNIEAHWCEQFDVANNSLFYNRTNKGTGYPIGVPNVKLSNTRKSMKITPWCKGETKETNETVRLISEKLKGKSSGMKGKVAWNKGKPGTMTGKKHTKEAYAKLFWERPKIECEECGRLIGINNIKVHKRKQHNLLK